MLSKVKKNKYLSYSQINTFLNCPHRYQLLYIDKIKVNSESIESYMGKIVHEVLEWMYNERSNYYIWDSVEDQYKKKWKNKWHSEIYIAPIKKQYDKDYFMKLGLECLRNYYNNNSGPNIDTQNIIDNEMIVYAKIGEYTFKGIIDRLDENGEYIEIHDYKTGKVNTERVMKKDMQLVIYSLAVKSIYPNKKIALNWHFLKQKNREKQHVRIILDQKNLIRIKAEILNHADSIALAKEKNNFIPNEGFLCNWCYLWKNCKVKKVYNETNPSVNAS